MERVIGEVEVKSFWNNILSLDCLERLEKYSFHLWTKWRVVRWDFDGFVAHVGGLVGSNEVIDILPLLIEIFPDPIVFLEDGRMNTRLTFIYAVLGLTDKANILE